MFTIMVDNYNTGFFRTQSGDGYKHIEAPHKIVRYFHVPPGNSSFMTWAAMTVVCRSVLYHLAIIIIKIIRLTYGSCDHCNLIG